MEYSSSVRKAIENNAREFAVLASGHGSKLRFDGEDPYHPPAPLTLDEVVVKCLAWESIADTIGGYAVPYHIPTETTINDFKSLYKKQKEQPDPWTDPSWKKSSVF